MTGKRRLCAEQPGGQGVAQRVQALALRRLELDAGQLPPVGHDTVEPVVLADRLERWRQVGEEMPVLDRRSPCSQVVDERGTDLLDQRQDQRLTRLVLHDLDGGRGPVQVVERQRLMSPRRRPRREASSKMA
jgi:hypothetical protein